MDPELIGAWPGKTIDSQLHPALWHMLDVGAVATRLISRRSLTRSEPGDRAATFLIVLHDLGKFSSSFRSMLLGQPPRGPRHWQHSYRLLRHHDRALADFVGGTPSVRRILYAAVAGHHGGPPQDLDHRKYRDQAKQIGDELAMAYGRGVVRQGCHAIAQWLASTD